MTNHVKQLRAFGDACGGLERRGLNAAADRIEALERENAALVALVQDAMNHVHDAPTHLRIRLKLDAISGPARDIGGVAG